MPPELLAHFKKKAEEKGGEAISSAEEKNESDKTRRKEAVKKARVRIEERSKEASRDKKEATGKGSNKAS